MFRTSFKALLLVLFAALSVSLALGQGGTGELTGLVSDPTGAVVANATVTLTNDATGEKRTTTSTAAGIYRFVALPIIGTYTLETTPKGFKTTRVANVVVSVGTVTSHDIQLEVGTGSETVTVEAGAQVVQTEDSSVSQLIDHRTWESMPMQTRSQNELINLVAGAEPQVFNDTGRGASVNGTRSGTGNYLVEGVDNNEQGQGGVALFGPGGANTTISPDAIQEYRVLTHDFSAEYGKAGGFVTDTVLKSGTNRWHGSAFEYNRNQNITANDWFSNSANIRDHLVRNQFGGSLGGPVKKDKTFFYAAGEIQRLRQSAPVTGASTTVTQQFLDFVNSGGFENFMENDPNGACVLVHGSPCPGALNLSGSLGPIWNQLKTLEPNAFPAAQSSVTCDPLAATNDDTCFGQGVYTFGLVYPVPVYGSVTPLASYVTDQSRFSVKFDHRFTDRDQLSVSYLFDDVQSSDTGDGGNTPVGVPEVVPSRAQNASIAWTRNLSSTVLNQFRLGYLRRNANFVAPGSEGIPSIFTFVDPIQMGFGGGAGLPQFFTENQYQVKDDLSVTMGRHNWKYGFEYRRTQNASKFFNDLNGTAFPWSVEDLVTDMTFTDQFDLVYFGYPAYGSCAFCGASIDASGDPASNPNFGKLPIYQRNYRANEYGLYALDDWRVNSRLTLNLGIRWDYFGPPQNAKPGLDSNFYFGPPTTPIVTTSINPFFPANSPYWARVATGGFDTRHPIWNQDRNNFAPRFGFSWDTRGDQKIVVRGGFGIMYDRIYNNIFENIRFNPPFFADVNFGFFGANGIAGGLSSPGFYQVPFVANQNGLLASFAFKASPRHMDQNLVSPYYEQTHFGVQYQLGKDMVLETDYVGTFGRKLIGILNDNTFDGRTAGGDSTRPNPNIGSDNFRTNAFKSNYHALQVQLRKRYANGLQLNGSYTYGKTLDTLSDAFRAKGPAGANACQVSDCSNPNLDYGPADFDVKHRGVLSYTYDLPFARANRFIGGWQVNGIFSVQTGVPIPVVDLNNDLNADGLVGADRPEFAPGFNGKNVKTDRSAGIQFLNPAGYQSVTCTANGGAWCNSPMHRNSVYGPHFWSWDFGFGKSFTFTESAKLTFMANFFNIFNHPNFDTPEENIGDPNFGRSIATLGDDGGHRVGQLALRIDF